MHGFVIKYSTIMMNKLRIILFLQTNEEKRITARIAGSDLQLSLSLNTNNSKNQKACMKGGDSDINTMLSLALTPH